jgi:3'(2'), 5'-bisphosphate nucleotidase
MLSHESVTAIKLLLRNAAEAIMEVYNSSFTVHLKSDDSPVTRADMISNKIITDGLKLITPGVPVISEETSILPYEERRLFKDLWILDPLDGTREFVKKNGEFCISLALVNCGRPVAGFIYAPVSGELWYALKGSGSYREKDHSIVQLPFDANDGVMKIVISRSHHNETEKEWIEKIAATHNAETIIQGSAIKFCRLAESTVSVYPKFGSINEWDVAAGDIILEEAGGIIIETATGKPPRYNKPALKQPHFIACARGIEKLIRE